MPDRPIHRGGSLYPGRCGCARLKRDQPYALVKIDQMHFTATVACAKLVHRNDQDHIGKEPAALGLGETGDAFARRPRFLTNIAQ